MDAPKLVSRDEWTAARLALLAEEKALTRQSDELAKGDAYYNFRHASPFFPEMQGLSVFAKTADGRVAHAYSTYGRGIDVFNGAYQILDLTPKGRDEGDAFDPMFWLRRRDQYGVETPTNVGRARAPRRHINRAPAAAAAPPAPRRAAATLRPPPVRRR